MKSDVLHHRSRSAQIDLAFISAGVVQLPLYSVTPATTSEVPLLKLAEISQWKSSREDEQALKLLRSFRHILAPIIVKKRSDSYAALLQLLECTLYLIQAGGRTSIVGGIITGTYFRVVIVSFSGVFVSEKFDYTKNEQNKSLFEQFFAQPGTSRISPTTFIDFAFSEPSGVIEPPTNNQSITSPSFSPLASAPSSSTSPSSIFKHTIITPSTSKATSITDGTTSITIPIATEPSSTTTVATESSSTSLGPNLASSTGLPSSVDLAIGLDALSLEESTIQVSENLRLRATPPFSENIGVLHNLRSRNVTEIKRTSLQSNSPSTTSLPLLTPTTATSTTETLFLPLPRREIIGKIDLRNLSMKHCDKKLPNRPMIVYIHSSLDLPCSLTGRRTSGFIVTVDCEWQERIFRFLRVSFVRGQDRQVAAYLAITATEHRWNGYLGQAKVILESELSTGIENLTQDMFEKITGSDEKISRKQLYVLSPLYHSIHTLASIEEYCLMIIHALKGK